MVVYDTYADSVEDYVAVNVVPGLATGMQENSWSDDVQVYPNPAMEVLTVALNQFSEGTTMSIVSIDGRTVYTTAINSVSQTIDISGISPGSYFILVKSDQKLLKKRWVKLK
jgi:hypothetical protein